MSDSSPELAKTRPFRVLLWGTYDTGKPRVRILREGLRRSGVEVLEIHHALWAAIEDKSQVRGAGRWLKLVVGALLAYPRLLWRYLTAPQHDVVLIAYPGIIDLFVLRAFAWMRRVPISLDWFLSAYDTIVLDRRLMHRCNPAAGTIFAVEWCAIRLADMVFMDTAAHARRMERLFGLSEGRIGRVWVGAEAGEFALADIPCDNVDNRNLAVLFYGQCIPLHGASTIVEAASLLRDAPIDWHLIGTGQEARKIDAELERLQLPRVHRVDWVPYERLREALARADVVLGIFGTSDKAASVIPNKVFQTLMARRPLITRDSAAIRELVAHSPPHVQLVAPGDAKALAAAVMLACRELGSEPQLPNVPSQSFDEGAIGRQLVDLLRGSRDDSRRTHD